MPNDDDSVDVKVLAALGQERLATLLAEVAMTNACASAGRLRYHSSRVFEISLHQRQSFKHALTTGDYGSPLKDDGVLRLKHGQSLGSQELTCL